METNDRWQSSNWVIEIITPISWNQLTFRSTTTTTTMGSLKVPTRWEMTDLKELEIVCSCLWRLTVFLDQTVTTEYLVKIPVRDTDTDTLLKIAQSSSSLAWVVLRSHLYGGYHMVSWHSHALLMAVTLAAGGRAPPPPLSPPHDLSAG